MTSRRKPLDFTSALESCAHIGEILAETDTMDTMRKPLWFQLYATNDCIDLCHSNQQVLEQFPTFMFFGSNGGLESIAFDLRVGPPWPIVMIDQIAGPESAEEIAPNMASFIEVVGLEAEGQAKRQVR